MYARASVSFRESTCLPVARLRVAAAVRMESGEQQLAGHECRAGPNQIVHVRFAPGPPPPPERLRHRSYCPAGSWMRSVGAGVEAAGAGAGAARGDVEARA